MYQDNFTDLLSAGFPLSAVFLGLILSVYKVMLWRTADRTEVQPIAFLFSNGKWIILNWAVSMIFDLISDTNNYVFKKFTLTECCSLVASTLFKMRSPSVKNKQTNKQTWVCTPNGWMLIYKFKHELGLPRWCSGKESACQCRKHKGRGFDPCMGKIPWRRKWQLTPIFLPGKLYG